MVAGADRDIFRVKDSGHIVGMYTIDHKGYDTVMVQRILCTDDVRMRDLSDTLYRDACQLILTFFYLIKADS